MLLYILLYYIINSVLAKWSPLIQLLHYFHCVKTSSNENPVFRVTEVTPSLHINRTLKFTIDYSSGTVRVSAQEEPFLFKPN